jgi:hypothetical protein
MTKLATPSQDVVDRLATEPGVVEHDIRELSTAFVGLDEPSAIALLNDLSFRRSWNMSTYLAASELLDAALTSTN